MTTDIVTPQVPMPSTAVARLDPALEREAYMLSLDLAELTAVVPRQAQPHPA
jgi:hypothetical protein